MVLLEVKSEGVKSIYRRWYFWKLRVKQLRAYIVDGTSGS